MGEIAIFGGRRVLEAKRRAEGGRERQRNSAGGVTSLKKAFWMREEQRGGESTDAGRDGGVVVVNLSQFTGASRPLGRRTTKVRKRGIFLSHSTSTLALTILICVFCKKRPVFCNAFSTAGFLKSYH